MNATFPYNSSTNGHHQPTAPPAAFYHAPTSGFQFHQYPTAAALHNGSTGVAPAPPTAFANVLSSRGYQQPPSMMVNHGGMQNAIGHYQIPDSRNEDEDDVHSLDSMSDSRTPTQSDQQISAPMQTRKRRRGVIEKRRRDRINTSLAELRRLVPAASEKQGTQKLEKAEILQMTVDHLRVMGSKGLNTLWRDQQRYATEYYSMGFRVCINEIDTFLSKEGMDMQDPLRLRLMSHLQCVGVQRQSAFNIWAASSTGANPSSHYHHHQHHGQQYWPATAAASPASTGLQYATIYGTIAPTATDAVYPSAVVAPTSTAAAVNGGQQQVHHHGSMNGQAQVPPPPVSTFANGNMMNTFVSTPASSTSNGVVTNAVSGSPY